MEETMYLKRTALPGRLAVALAVVAMLMIISTKKSYGQTVVASNSGPVCTGGTVTLYETGGSAVAWLWSSSGTATFNDNTLQNPVATGVLNGEVFTVQITDAGGNTASATTTVTVYSAPPARPGNVTGDEAPCVNTTGLVYSITPVVNATSYLWEVPEGVEITSGQGTISITVNVGPDAAETATLRVYAINACGTSSSARSKNLNAVRLPVAAGPITGSATFTPGSAGVAYSVATITGATAYNWGYTGTGVIINGNGTASVTLDFSAGATEGRLSVYGTNQCGSGEASGIDLTSAVKTLTILSVLLEGLYSGAGTMRQAWNETGPQYEAGVADHVTIEIHDATVYSTLVWSIPGVALSTSGTVQVNVPSSHDGSYYITVRHRNSIATVSAQPVSFSGSSISHSFGDPSGVYGGNLKLSADGRYLIYGGDANQDGTVDTGDYTPVVNDASRYTRGYIYTDIDGNGSVDTGDYSIMVNNATRYIRTIRPL